MEDIAHEMSLKDKEELHNKSSGAYKASCEVPTSSSEKQTFNEELSLMVNVGVKTGGSRVGGPKQCVLGSMVIGDKGHDVLPRFGPSRWR